MIGGGSGGLAAAFRASTHGARVALLEPAELGGTCVNAGCVPKKAMWLAAGIAGTLQLARSVGFPIEPAPLDWPTFITHRQHYIANIHDSYRHRLDESGVVLIPMRARLRGANTIQREDGMQLTATHVLIATGGHPVKPDIPGAHGWHLGRFLQVDRAQNGLQRGRPIISVGTGRVCRLRQSCRRVCPWPTPGTD